MEENSNGVELVTKRFDFEWVALVEHENDLDLVTVANWKSVAKWWALTSEVRHLSLG